jgi:monoamine oxidase
MKPTSIARLMRQVGEAPSGISRRRFLQATLVARAALMLPQRQYSSAQAGSRPRVVVIGAGFAGLSCAYQLKRPGADMQVLEARNRVGGRVFSQG